MASLDIKLVEVKNAKGHLVWKASAWTGRESIGVEGESKEEAVSLLMTEVDSVYKLYETHTTKKGVLLENNRFVFIMTQNHLDLVQDIYWNTDESFFTYQNKKKPFGNSRWHDDIARQYNMYKPEYSTAEKQFFEQVVREVSSAVEIICESLCCKPGFYVKKNHGVRWEYHSPF